MQEIIVTKHAYDRLKERCGLNKKAADRMAETAFKKGISHSETNGQLHKYISGKINTHKRKGTHIKIYGEIVYCFVDEENFDRTVTLLVTVFEVPQTLKKKALGKQSKIRKEKADAKRA